MSDEQAIAHSGGIEELLKKHRKEIRDLTATITSLKKQATKKTRKNVLSKCNQLEQELKEKHAKELATLNGNQEDTNREGTNNNEDSEEVTPEKLLAAMDLGSGADTEITTIAKPIGDVVPSSTTSAAEIATDGTASKSGPKRNRQKERLARRQAEIDRLKEEARQEALQVPDYKKLEEEAMSANITANDMQLYEIQPDGNCLFSSIKDQLEQTFNDDTSYSVQDLRIKAGDYILENKSTFEPFMYNEQTDELEDIDEYVEKLKSTSMWGSDKEILAFAKLFNCTISVLSYDTVARKTNTFKINERDDKEAGQDEQQLNLAYYKHTYGLGEHYNSLRRK